MNKERNSNFEILRIIAMFMIIIHHLAYHSQFNFPYNEITFNRLWIQFIQIGGEVGVNVFVLITGYFMLNHSFKIEKVLKLWFEVLFYSIVIYVLMCLIGRETFTIVGLVSSFMPISREKWWFASSYIILYILSPYINILITNISKKVYKKLLIICFVMWVIFPTFLFTSFGSNNVMWFIYLYLLAGYIKKYEDELGVVVDFSFSKWFMTSIAIYILTFLSALLIDIVGLSNYNIAKCATHFYGKNQLPILMISLCLFMAFKKLEIRTNKFINKVALTTFGVYLIHDNPAMRGFIWNDLFKTYLYSDSRYLIIYSIVVAFVIYIVCSIIDFVRINLAEKVIAKIINFIIIRSKKYEKSINNRWSRIYRK